MNAARTLRPARRNLVIGILALLLALIATGWAMLPQTETYASFTRPDGHYLVRVLRKKSLLPVLPGQAGDAAGVVQLLDRNGKLMRQIEVPMVQMVERVQWEDKHLSIKLIADWDLPD